MAAVLGMKLFSAAPSCSRRDAQTIARLGERCTGMKGARCDACAGTPALRDGERVVLEGLNRSHGLAAGHLSKPVYRYVSVYSCNAAGGSDGGDECLSFKTAVDGTAKQQAAEYARGGGVVLA
eukprot:4432532-Prymnesium_polylepis.1